MHRFFKLLAYVAAALLVIAATGCSTKKNNAATRNYQAFITRYNIYYNGDTHYKETLADMENKYEDDYSRLTLMHPVEAKGQASRPQPSGNFDRSIEKAQKAIQIRSIKKKPAKKSGQRNNPKYQEWMKREEYNPFMHNAWLMMGRGQYYNGDFLGAASTFFYISRHFSWLPQTVTEAKLMQALSYISLGWQFEAEMIIVRIKEDELTSKELRRLYNFVYADYYIHAEDYQAALPYLQQAVKDASGAQKTRLNFLLGQVCQKLGMKTDAYKAFKAAGGASSATYRTKFNARIKQSEVFDGKDISSEVKSLKRMTRYDRNKEYLDQIYYAIGNLYLSRGDTVNAIENYEIANEKSTRNGIDKAINQLKLGELYFIQGNYEKAQPNYAEAITQLTSAHPGYNDIKRRSDVLDELAVYSQNVNLQDSMLRLSTMPEDQRMAIINKIIEDLKEEEKKAEQEARRQDFMANQAAMGNTLQDNSSQSFTINSDNSWYFYNTATKNAGKTEFQKRWGSRKLEDDWRRRNKSSFNTDDFDATEDSDETAEEESGTDDTKEENVNPNEAQRAEDPHNPEYYLAQIPFSDEDKKTAHDIIQEGLYNMGVILKDKLEDFPAALKEFDRLLVDYPDNIYRLDTYYNLYLMYMRQGKTAEADKFKALILSDFPESKYGVAMKDPNYLDKLRNMDTFQQQLYEKTYQAYLDNRNDEVHRAYETMNESYPLSKVLPKFMFLHALAYVTEKDSENFNATLRDLLARYPDTDITPVAAAWLKGMAQGRELQASAGNLRGMIWDMKLTNDSTLAEGNNGPAEFTLDSEQPQVLVFTFPTDTVSTNELLYEIARHNFKSFVVKDFDLEPMNFGRLGMIVVRGFDNFDEINHYRRVMADSPDFRLPYGVRPIAISAENFRILLEEGRSFDEYFRYLEEQNYIDAQEGLLVPEDIEPLPPQQDNIIDEADAIAPEMIEPAVTQPTQPAQGAKPAPVTPAKPKNDDPLPVPDDEDFEP